MVGHVDAHRRVVAGDQTRGGGLAGGDLDGAAQHQNARGWQLQHAREVADLAGLTGRLGSPEEASATSRSGGRSSGVIGVFESGGSTLGS